MSSGIRELVADLLSPECRPMSPANRPAEYCADTSESPKSPESPTRPLACAPRLTDPPKQAAGQAAPTRICAECRNVSKFGNCKEPVRAGLSVHFELIAAAEGHAGGCPAFEPKVARPVRPSPTETSGHWLIVQPARRTEHWYSPAVTRAELETRYPGAALIALPETASEKPRPANAEEAAELTRLVATVATREGFSDAERTEALHNALRDPEAASRSLRALRDIG